MIEERTCDQRITCSSNLQYTFYLQDFISMQLLSDGCLNKYLINRLCLIGLIILLYFRSVLEIFSLVHLFFTDLRINVAHGLSIGTAIPTLSAILGLGQNLIRLLDLHEFLLSLAPFVLRSFNLVGMIIPGQSSPSRRDFVLRGGLREAQNLQNDKMSVLFYIFLNSDKVS